MGTPTKCNRYILAPSGANEGLTMNFIMTGCTYFSSWWQSCAIVGGKSNFHATGKSITGDIVVVTITTTKHQYSRCQNEWVWLCKRSKNNWWELNRCLSQDCQPLFSAWLTEIGRLSKQKFNSSLQYFHRKLYISVNFQIYVISFHFWPNICTNIRKSILHCRRASIYSDRSVNHSGHRHHPQMSIATLILQMSALMSMIMLKKRKLVVEKHWLRRLSIVVGPLTTRATYVVFGLLEI